jgi:hypothetical protein
MVTSEGEKQKQLGPTITVTVAAFAAVDHEAKSRAALTAAIARTNEVFIGLSHLVLLVIAHWNSKQSIAARNSEKVTRLLLCALRYWRARDPAAGQLS